MNGAVAFAGVAPSRPGPDTLLVVRVGGIHGRRAALVAGLGVCTALSGWGCAAALGLTAMLAASPVLFTVLRWGGVAYRAHLGIRVIGARIPAGVPVLAGGLLLASIHVAGSAAWLAVAALLSGRLGRLLRRPGPRCWAGRLSAAAFLGFAARLALRG